MPALALLDQRRKLHRLAVFHDLHVGHGAANPHGAYRSRDFHSAGIGGLASDEGEGPGGQADQHRIRRALRVVDELVYLHPGMLRHLERGAVAEHDTKLGVGGGLDHVILIDRIVDLQRLSAAGRESGLYHHRSGVVNLRRAGQGDDLADRLHIDGFDRLRCALGPCGMRRQSGRQAAGKTRDQSNRAHVCDAPSELSRRI